MADNVNTTDNNLNEFRKGLVQDTDPIDSPKGSYTFALNSVIESSDGHMTVISNEGANKKVLELKPEYSIIGNIYIGDNCLCLFLANGNNVSEIGIFNTDDNSYKTIVNDIDSLNEDKLNFSINHPIHGVYRLRRGCDKTIYFTDNNNPLRYFNLSNPNIFKKNGKWDFDKFLFFRNVGTYPILSGLQVVEKEGFLPSGSYTIMLQYLDEDLNSSQFIEVTSNINIFVDSLDKDFSDIGGSINYKLKGVQDKDNPYHYEDSNKAIRISISNLDRNFPYIRYALVCYQDGVGTVSKVLYSDPIPTLNSEFTFTGKNLTQKGTLEEVTLTGLNTDINKVGHIEQIENRLILANTSGNIVSLEKLQKYASLIQTDAIKDRVLLTDVRDAGNGKNPLIHQKGTGYLPGEVYSFGIIYIYDDFTSSPALHIPGKSQRVTNTHVYSPGTNVIPMSNRDNTSLTERYTSNQSCTNYDFWGTDCNGDKLSNTLVRHHRFPTRKELNLPLISTLAGSDLTFNYYNCSLIMSELPKQTVKCDGSDPSCVAYEAITFEVEVRLTLSNGSEERISLIVEPDNIVSYYSLGSNLYEDPLTEIIETKLFYRKVTDNDFTEIPIQAITLEDGDKLAYESVNKYEEAKFKIKISNASSSSLSNDKIFTTILGVKFSNVIIPDEAEIGKKIVGYQIVRLNREDEDKTIIDTGIVFPMLTHGRFTSTGFLSFSGTWDNPHDKFFYRNFISSKSAMILSYNHKFLDNSPDGFTNLEEVGHYTTEKITTDGFSITDALPGSSATGKEQKGTTDNDGWTVRHAIRHTKVKYVPDRSNPLSIASTNTRLYNFSALGHNTDINGTTELYNLSADNSALILDNKSNGVFNHLDIDNNNGTLRYPYVNFKKSHRNFYNSFQNRIYYIVDNNMFTTSTCEVFGGDNYVSPMRYSNNIFLNTVQGTRSYRKGLGDFLTQILTIAAAALLFIIPGGQAAAVATLITVGASLLAAGAIVSIVATAIKDRDFHNAYYEKWYQGLDKTVYDWFYQYVFVDPDTHNKFQQPTNYRDDTINWLGDVVGDFWMDSTINTNLRVAPTTQTGNFLRPLKPHMNQTWVTDNGRVGGLIHIGRFYRRGLFRNGAGVYGYENNYISPQTDNGWFFYNKLFITDRENNNKAKYTGMSLPIVYCINNDFNINRKLKKHYTVSLTYDFCSECVETFPHRVWYSEQAFQEEKTDNYRKILPNNYRDIEGETGEITNLFRLNNNLYIHTKEALWMLPRNYQERVTDQIVSFIGTGSYFEIPPQKIVDNDTGLSSGTTHKWASLKIPAGYFFISDNEQKVNYFNGRDITPISDQGLSKWFQNNIPMSDKPDNYIKTNNPFSPIGTGFISTYDNELDRIIFTKRDVKLKEDILSDNNLYRVIDSNRIILFRGYLNIITNKRRDNWNYLRIEKDKMKFSKTVLENRNYKTIYSYVDGEYVNISEIIEKDLSWTISYSLNTKSWVSWHSYTPYCYLYTSQGYYSLTDKNNLSNEIYKHNQIDYYQKYYNRDYPHIIDYNSVSSPIVTRIWNHISLQTKCGEYDTQSNTFIDDNKITFNKAILYNTRQCSGLINLNSKPLEEENTDYLLNQVLDNTDSISIDRREYNWYINNFRNLRTTYNVPLWNNNIDTLTYQNGYIDKELNSAIIDYNLDWTKQENFRDKYLSIRLIFDTFANKKLLTNFTYENETQSFF